MTITTDPVKFNISHQFIREPVTRFLITGTEFTVGKWTISGQLWRDLVLDRNTQKEYKLHYSSQCWGLNVKFLTQPGVTQYLVTFDLKGLGGTQF